MGSEMCIRDSGSSVESGFHVIFRLRFTIGRSGLRMFRENFYGRTCLEVLAVASFRQKWEKKLFLRKRLTVFGPFDGLWSVGTRVRH